MRRKMKGLYVVINTEKKFKHCPTTIAKMACEGGADFIQLRDKRDIDKEKIKLARTISNICCDFQIPFIVNDRFDIALLAHASGVHLGQKDIDPVDVRSIVGKDFIIGGTAANLNEAKKIEPYCDYISLGHIYPTLTKKKDYPPLGVKMIRVVKKHIRIPLVCIGGIDHTRVRDVISAGANAIAVVRAACDQENPKDACVQLKKAIDSV